MNDSHIMSYINYASIYRYHNIIYVYSLIYHNLIQYTIVIYSTIVHGNMLTCMSRVVENEPKALGHGLCCSSKCVLIFWAIVVPCCSCLPNSSSAFTETFTSQEPFTALKSADFDPSELQTASSSMSSGISAGQRIFAYSRESEILLGSGPPRAPSIPGEKAGRKPHKTTETGLKMLVLSRFE